MKLKLTLMTAMLASAVGAQAQTAGTWLVQAGVTRVTPDVTSGDLTAPAPSGTKSDVGPDTQPTAQLTYMVNDRLAVALPLGLGFTHKIYGAGAIKIGRAHV